MRPASLLAAFIALVAAEDGCLTPLVFGTQVVGITAATTFCEQRLSSSLDGRVSSRGRTAGAAFSHAFISVE
jgi:hypothetical protein